MVGVKQSDFGIVLMRKAAHSVLPLLQADYTPIEVVDNVCPFSGLVL
jgi:hypothetical protein